MAVPIGRIDPKLLSQIMGPAETQPVQQPVAAAGSAAVPVQSSPFDDILGKAVNALEGVGKMENQTNTMVNQYIAGNAELSDVMIQTAKMNLVVTLAVTTVTSAVNTFKEITQMQI